MKNKTLTFSLFFCFYSHSSPVQVSNLISTISFFPWTFVWDYYLKILKLTNPQINWQTSQRKQHRANMSHQSSSLKPQLHQDPLLHIYALHKEKKKMKGFSFVCINIKTSSFNLFFSFRTCSFWSWFCV